MFHCSNYLLVFIAPVYFISVSVFSLYLTSCGIPVHHIYVSMFQSVLSVFQCFRFFLSNITIVWFILDLLKWFIQLCQCSCIPEYYLGVSVYIFFILIALFQVIQLVFQCYIKVILVLLFVWILSLLQCSSLLYYFSIFTVYSRLVAKFNLFLYPLHLNISVFC